MEVHKKCRTYAHDMPVQEQEMMSSEGWSDWPQKSYWKGGLTCDNLK